MPQENAFTLLNVVCKIMLIISEGPPERIGFIFELLRTYTMIRKIRMCNPHSSIVLAFDFMLTTRKTVIIIL